MEAYCQNITVIGFGGCGINTLNDFLKYNLTGLCLAAVAGTGSAITDQDNKVKTYPPDDLDVLARNCSKNHICFLIGGLGGPISERMPFLAQKIRKQGAMVVALCTMPFRFEWLREKADLTLENLQKQADAVLLFPNDIYLNKMPPKTPMTACFGSIARDMLDCVLAMTQTVDSGQIRIDAADVRSCLRGIVRHGIGRSNVEAAQAAREAIDNLAKNIPENWQLIGEVISVLKPLNSEYADISSLGLIAGEEILKGASIIIATGNSADNDWTVVILATATAQQG